MNELNEKQRTAVAEHFTLENAHEWPKVVATFTAENPAFELVPAAARLSGWTAPPRRIISSQPHCPM